MNAMGRLLRDNSVSWQWLSCNGGLREVSTPALPAILLVSHCTSASLKIAYRFANLVCMHGVKKIKISQLLFKLPISPVLERYLPTWCVSQWTAHDAQFPPLTPLPLT